MEVIQNRTTLAGLFDHNQQLRKEILPYKQQIGELKGQIDLSEHDIKVSPKKQPMKTGTPRSTQRKKKRQDLAMDGD